jgi:hypothetical protein
MPNVIGRFYFNKTNSGNLIGEFSNSGMKTVDSECANIESNPDSFIGVYNSVWEDDDGPHYAKLVIAYKSGTGDKIVSLKWIAKNNKTTFWGEGMFVDDLLIGDYRNFELIPKS